MKNLPHLRMVVAELNHIWMNAWWYWCKAWPSASESCILQCSDVDIWCTILEFLFSHYRLINTLRLQIITFFMFCRVVFLVVNSWIKWMVSKTILSINLFTVCKCEVRSMFAIKQQRIWHCSFDYRCPFSCWYTDKYRRRLNCFHIDINITNMSQSS